METIRRSNLNDCKAVYDLICDMEAKKLPFEAFSRIYASQQADEGFVCLVCEVDDQVVGCINLRMEYQLHHAARICEIMELAVDKDCRSQGLGRCLFEAACGLAKERGCSQIEVSCNQLRERTHRFYEARGMHNFHYKFSLDFSGGQDGENRLGR